MLQQKEDHNVTLEIFTTNVMLIFTGLCFLICIDRWHQTEALCKVLGGKDN